MLIFIWKERERIIDMVKDCVNHGVFAIESQQSHTKLSIYFKLLPGFKQ